MNIQDIMQNMQNEDGTFSEGDINKLSEVTRKDKDELFEIYNSGKQSTIPEGNVKDWDREKKLKFISDNRDSGGFEAYKKLVNERK